MVTDLLDFHLAGWHWPAFNLADSAAVLGATLLLEPERTRTTVSTEAFPEPVR